MELGEVRSYRGQRYECVGLRPYTRRDGSATALAEMASACAKCGVGFVFCVPVEAAVFQPNRRCAKHKMAGRRVRW